MNSDVMEQRGARPPAVIGALALLASASALLPLVAIVAGVPGRSAAELLTRNESLTALGLSLMTAICSAAVCTVLGVPLAFLLARTRFPARSLVRALILVPMVLPPVVSGLALLMTFGRNGLLGPLLSAMDLRIVFTTTAVVLAQVFVSLPFTVLTIESALQTLGAEPELVATQLGASPWRVWVTISLPRLWPAILTGAVLAFARSLGEFGATLTFAGSMPGITRTLPLEIYRVREIDPAAAATLSLLLVLVALVVVIIAYARPQRRSQEQQQPLRADSAQPQYSTGTQPALRQGDVRQPQCGGGDAR